MGGIESANREIVGDPETYRVVHFNALSMDVVAYHLGQCRYVRGDNRDLLRAQVVQGLNEGSSRRDDGCIKVRGSLRRSVKFLLRPAVVALSLSHYGDQTRVGQHVHISVGQLYRATFGIAVHRPKLFGRDVLHPHATGVERKPLRTDRLSQMQHGGNLRLHCRIGTRHDQTNAQGSHKVSPRVLTRRGRRARKAGCK